MAKRISLQVHPDTPCGAPTAIEVEFVRNGPRSIALRFIASGDIDALDIPPLPKARGERRDELWRHTCFEVFVRAGASTSYHEFNLAPSGDWACYRFDGYRQGMTAEADVGEPRIDTLSRREPWSSDERARPAQSGSDPLAGFETPFFMLSATLDLDRTMLALDVPWHLGLSAVIEERNGNISYWAVKHPPGKPDFHHPDCFAVQLAAARPA